MARDVTSRAKPPIVGIDLGTTTSAIAYVDNDGKARVIEDECGKAVLPSAVKFGKDGHLLSVGQEALSNSSEGITLTSVKRLIGKRYDEVSDKDQVSRPYQIMPSSDGGILLRVNERTIQPEEASAHLLKHLLARANKTTFQNVEGDIEEAVITIPVYFNSSQKAATLSAARQAGLQRITFLQEPVAAAMAHGHGQETDFDTILVCDLGGGTLDLSLVESFDGVMEVIASGGEELGGDDFTAVALSILLEEIEAKTQRRDWPAEIMLLLWREAERVKVALTTNLSAEVKLSGLDQSLDHISVTITREQLDARSMHLIARLWATLRQLAIDTRLQLGGSLPQVIERSESDERLFQDKPGRGRFSASRRRISSLCFVGAATRMPSVSQFVECVTGLRAGGSIDPEEAVVIGASVHAGVLQGTLSSRIELTDGTYNQVSHGRVHSN